jgi:predicted RNase H-like nuclease (RuvC/YqgF family)
MSYFGSSTITITGNQNDSIIFYTVTGNLNEIKKKINRTNVNSVIDTKNKYTILHYAVGLQNTEVIKYILECGGDPEIVTKDGKDSFELATDKNKMLIHNFFLDKKENEIYKLKSTNDDLKYKINNLESSLEYTKKSSENYNLKIDKLNTENNSLKRKLDDTTQKVYKLEKDLDETKNAFNNLLKKQKK